METNMNGIIKTLGIVALMGALSACGSGLSSPSGSGSSGSSGSGSNNSSGSAQTGTSLLELGNGNGTAFVNQTLLVQVPSLSAGGSTTITATIVDANNSFSLYTGGSITVNFSSTCVSNNLASFSNATITTSNGVATTSYTATGCNTSDPITATVLVGAIKLQATGALTVAPASIGSIQFISATPSVIALQGVGGVTSSEVIFQVNDTNGHAVPNATVTFTLSTTAGGITMSPTTAQTGTDGQASTFVQSGTVHTTVNVIASVPGPNSTTISTETPNAIAVSTGIPVQTHMSISLETHNLSLSYGHDGITDVVTVHAADRYGNPPTTGTNILFVTNSGTIGSSCATDATGACNVTWTSAGNRPATDTLDVLGHVHILAYTAGEEHYTDVNSDNVFDNGDAFTLLASAPTGDVFEGLNLPGSDDIGDPYMDSAETGQYKAGEFFADIDSSVTTRRAPDGKWYGVGCGGFGSNTASVTTTGGTVLCANKLTMNGVETCMIEDTDAATLTVKSFSSAITFDSTTGTYFLDHTQVTASAPATMVIDVADINGNFIGSGSAVGLTQNSVSGETISQNPASPSSATTFAMPDAPCGTPGSSVTEFTITVTPISAATTFGGSFYLQYTSSDGKIAVGSPSVTIF